MVIEEENDCKLRKEKSKFPKKIVVRKLPPSFTEEDFMSSVQPLTEYNYFSFVKADKSLGIHAFSRAYINFVNQDDVFIFRDQFDGYVFVDQKGIEYPAMVEYAPFPKIPKLTKQRPDPRCNTINDDEDYLAFIESLNDQSGNSVPQIEAMLEEIEKEERLLKAASGTKTKTPLLEYIEHRATDRQKMIERRKKKDIERKKSREEERKKRKEMAKKREEIYREEREKLRLKREQKEKLIKDAENDKQKMDDTTHKEIKHGQSNEKKSDRSHKYSAKATESTPVRTKRYSEVRKREEREKKSSNMEAVSDSSCKSPSTESEKPKVSDIAGNTEIQNEDFLTTDDISKEEVNYEREYRTESSDYQKDRSKDPRSERRIRNKDRPDMQLYRPGQSKLKSSAKSSDSRTDLCSSSASSSASIELSQEVEECKTGFKTTANTSDSSSHQYESPEKYYDNSEKSTRIKASRKGYSYQQDRESRKKYTSRNTEEGCQFKSKTFKRSSQE